MVAIDKIRRMHIWFDHQSEYFNDQFKTINQLEAVFNYAQEHNLEFMDNDYLFSDYIEPKEREAALKFISKILRS